MNAHVKNAICNRSKKNLYILFIYINLPIFFLLLRPQKTTLFTTIKLIFYDHRITKRN